MKAHPADCPGWIYERDAETGARIVKDRCMTCNQPPWLRKRRRQEFIHKFFPLILVGIIAAAEFGIVEAIILYHKVFG